MHRDDRQSAIFCNSEFALLRTIIGFPRGGLVSKMRIPSILVIFFMLVGCNQSFPLSWYEKVQLHDGRIIDIDREAFIAGPPLGYENQYIQTFSIHFKHPSNGKQIYWKGYDFEKPLLIDFDGDTAWLVAAVPAGIAPIYRDGRNRGCPEIPYIFLRYDPETNIWKQEKPADAPNFLRFTNLSYQIDLRKHYPTYKNYETIASENEKFEKSKNNYQHSYQQEIPRDFNSWKYGNKDRYQQEDIHCKGFLGDWKEESKSSKAIKLIAPFLKMPIFIYVIVFVSLIRLGMILPKKNFHLYSKPIIFYVLTAAISIAPFLHLYLFGGNVASGYIILLCFMVAALPFFIGVSFDLKNLISKKYKFREPIIFSILLIAAFSSIFYFNTAAKKIQSDEQDIIKRQEDRYRDKLRQQDISTKFSPQEVVLEIADQVDYKPPKEISTTNGDWSNLVWDSERNEQCKNLLSPESFNSPYMLFKNDPSKSKKILRPSHNGCEKDAVWTVDYSGEHIIQGVRRQNLILKKFSSSGDLIYKLVFAAPEAIPCCLGSLIDTTLKEESGYLRFEWWHTQQTGSSRLVNRSLNVKIILPEPYSTFDVAE